MIFGVTIAGVGIVAAGCGGGGASTALHSAARPAAHTQVLGSTTWEGMRIVARAAPPTRFIVFDGASETTVKPARKNGFELLVTLTDAQSGVAIPYSTVVATIRKGSRVVVHGKLWPMISADANPAYGNDVAVSGAGSYRLSLLIDPPVSARHLEYQKVWLRPRRLTFAFRWDPAR